MPAVGLDETRDFYDAFFDHLLYDRLRLNPRHSVVRRLLRQYASRGAAVLDLGCGIGITSELAAKRAGAVVGVDLSPVLIEYARATVPSATFEAADITTVELGRTFDVVTLFDVYEHIPVDMRSALWRNIDRHLAPGGRVLMTVPHPAATEQAGATGAGGLQIVDEVVLPNELLRAAEESGLLPLALAVYGVDIDAEYYWLILERRSSPRPRTRPRFDHLVGRLVVRVRARRYWRAAERIRRPAG